MSADAGNTAVGGFFGLLDKLQDPFLGLCILAVCAMFYFSRKDRKEDQDRYDKLLSAKDSLSLEMMNRFEKMHDNQINSERETAKSNNELARALDVQQITLTMIANKFMGGPNGG